MQRTDNTVKAKSTGRHTGSSTTLNRKYVKRPGKSMDMVTTIDVKRSPKIKRFNNTTIHKSVKNASVVEPALQETEIQEPMVYNTEAQDALTYESEMQGLDASAFGMQDPMMQEESMVEEPMMEESEIEEPMMEEPIVEESLMQEAEMQESVMEQSEVEAQPVVMEQIKEDEGMVVEPHPMQVTANKRMKARKNTTRNTKKMTAKELKDQAIQKALASASTVAPTIKTKKESSLFPKLKAGAGRIVLALACAAVAVFAIAFFVNKNMPDISLRVAAMQTGINASYPSFVPRDYSISSITSGDKKITLDFKNGHTEEQFTLTEETSSWDSNALLTNYVKPIYHDNYSMTQEQGLTLYISGSNAVWVNGGVMYKISAEDGVLSNKQIRSIATSL